MASKKFILVGAKAEGEILKQYGYGGVLTLSNGLVDYAHKVGFEIEVINTLRPVLGHVTLLERIKAGIGRAFELFTLLRADKWDGVIIFSGAGWSFFERILLSLICKIYRVQCVFFMVDGWFLNVQNKPYLMRLLIGFLLRTPHKLAASGTNWVKFFRGLGVRDGNIVSVHYWLPKLFDVAEKPKVLQPGEPIRFVFIGWMIKEKGVYEILASLEILLKEYKFHFTFIGGGTLLESVRETIRVSGWEPSVSALGWLPPEQFDKAVSAAHVFVLPSYAEGFPMSLIEAMTKGMPSICTDVGGISDSLHDGVNGFLVPPKNVQALKKAMEFYICNPEYVTRHSLATLEIVRANHDADRNCNFLFNSFQETK
jgi:glycosyltransferase involved in cell wall biosynthesis